MGKNCIYRVITSCIDKNSLYRVITSCMDKNSLYRVFTSCMNKNSLCRVITSCMDKNSLYRVIKFLKIKYGHKLVYDRQRPKSALWLLSDCCLSVLWSLSECSNCSLIALSPMIMKIDCSRQTSAGWTDGQSESLSSCQSQKMARMSDHSLVSRNCLKTCLGSLKW